MINSNNYYWLANQFSVKVQMKFRAARDIILSFEHGGTEGLGEISRFRKFQGRSADLLRSENRPSAPPGTFPARGGALRRCQTHAWGIVKSAVVIVLTIC